MRYVIEFKDNSDWETHWERSNIDAWMYGSDRSSVFSTASQAMEYYEFASARLWDQFDTRIRELEDGAD